MDKNIVFTFIGGDKRQVETINILANEGFTVKAFGFPAILNKNVELYTNLEDTLFECDVLMLPIPYRDRNGLINIKLIDFPLTLEQVTKKILPFSVVILGKADKDFIEYARIRGIHYYDIVENEEFSILNAVPTAEGAIQKAMEKTDITLHQARVLILGYGRIGKTLAQMLKGIGALVTVEARRSSDLAWIQQNGYRGVHLNDLDSVLPEQEIIFNTVPSMILDRKRLEKVNRKAVIIDLASYPGGTDFKAAKRLGIQASLELGLPGKVAPRTAGKIICQVTKQLLKRHYLGEPANVRG